MNKNTKKIIATLIVMCAVVATGIRVKRMASIDPPGIPPGRCSSIVVIDPPTPPIMYSFMATINPQILP